MRTLAKGKSKKVVFKLIRVLVNSSQDNYGDADSSTVKEIADVIEADGSLGKFELKGNILMTDSAAQKRSDKFANLGQEVFIQDSFSKSQAEDDYDDEESKQ